MQLDDQWKSGREGSVEMYFHLASPQKIKTKTKQPPHVCVCVRGEKGISCYSLYFPKTGIKLHVWLVEKEEKERKKVCQAMSEGSVSAEGREESLFHLPNWLLHESNIAILMSHCTSERNNSWRGQHLYKLAEFPRLFTKATLLAKFPKQLTKAMSNSCSRENTGKKKLPNNA